MPDIPYGYCHCGCGEKTKLVKGNTPERNRVLGEPYKYLYRHDGFMQSARKPMYEIDENTGCWNWLRALTHDGYGITYNRMTRSKKHQGAHRCIYEQQVGPIPAGMTLDHKCKNRKCVNPAHMDVVSLKVNLQRGKQAKLLPDQAKWIREKHREGWSLRQLGDEFGIHSRTVQDVVTGKSWSNV